MGEPFFADCRAALSENGIFVTNWWQADKRYDVFVQRLRHVFDNRVLAVPAATHGNVAVLAFQSDPAVRQWDKLKKHAQTLNAQYHLDFTGMLAAIKAQQDGRNILSFD